MSDIQAHRAATGDYMEPFMSYWNTDANQAIAIISSEKIDGTADVLAVDWRDEASREQAQTFMGFLGIDATYPDFPESLEVLREHQTGKSKSFTDHLLSRTETGLFIMERRLILPRELSVVGSLYRAMSEREFDKDVRGSKTAALV